MLPKIILDKVKRTGSRKKTVWGFTKRDRKKQTASVAVAVDPEQQHTAEKNYVQRDSPPSKLLENIPAHGLVFVSPESFRLGRRQRKRNFSRTRARLAVVCFVRGAFGLRLLQHRFPPARRLFLNRKFSVRSKAPLKRTQSKRSAQDGCFTEIKSASRPPRSRPQNI